jgi:uncharacterized protein
MTGSVAWISLAPVKALGLVHPEEVLVKPFGISGNRRFHLVDAGGRMMNGKVLGELVGVRPSWDESTDTLTLCFPDGSFLEGVIRLGEPTTTEFYGRPVPGRFVDGAWANALSEFAGRALRLVRTDEPGEAVDRSAREGPVTLLGVGSLQALADAAGLDGPVDGRRFRMTFGVEGFEPHAEDGWIGRPVRIGEALVRPLGNVGRCAVTTQNPDTGIPDLDTLRVLKTYREEMRTTEPLPFGVHAAVLEPGRVRLGDPVVPEDSRPLGGRSGPV